MQKIRVWSCWAVAGLLTASAVAENEPIGEAPITALALFKNGVVSVMRDVRPPAKASAFLLTDKIEPAHGTFWCTAGDGFRLKTVSRTFEKLLETSPFDDICKAYDGCKVVVTVYAKTEIKDMVHAKHDGVLALFNTGGWNEVMELTGTVVNAAFPEQAKNFSRDYGEDARRYYNDSSSEQRSSRQPSRHLTLQRESGQHIFIPRDCIVAIHSEEINTTAQETREVWRVEGAQQPFTMTYLAKGATWAPAYRLNVLSDKQLSIAMSAIIRNELSPFTDAEINLISGFPNIEFAQCTSLMVPKSTLTSFFSGLARSQNDGQRGVTVQRQIEVMSNSIVFEPSRSLSLAPSEEASSMDIHHRTIGTLSMDMGETLYLPLEQADVAYERIVEWTIPDRRDVHGYIQNREGSMGDLWDTLCFRNPFKDPITTAPVEVTDGAKVMGQSTISWVNPGQEASVKITKALSVAGNGTEYEIDQKRPIITMGGYNYRNPDVEGEIRVKNYRGIPVKVNVRVHVSGEFLSASLEPTSRRLLETGVYGVNKRQEIVWTLSLAPGEEHTHTYRYSVLVRH
ncbi:MAG: DUF4139 domain-containing protein [Kiritimatiellaeota bacterium]|nr:DUF4139 domain-containing protein [Kiritimatiellota bacterium]